jgi:CBS domain-containing protein
MEKASTALVRGVVEFLRIHPPFDGVAPGALEAFAQAARLGYFAKGERIVEANKGTSNTLFVIQHGLVEGRAPAGRPSGDLVFGVGESFPIAAVFGARPTTLDYFAVEDTFAYAFDAQVVAQLAEDSAQFNRYCTHRLNALMVSAADRAAPGQDLSSGATADHPMLHPLGAIIRREPVTCSGDCSLRDALALMARHRIGAIVITNATLQPQGVFTERDLVRIAASGSLDLERRAVDYASSTLVMLSPTDLATEAALAMVKHTIRHVLVVDEGRLVGIVSERDLFALQRRTMAQVADGIALARAEGEFVHAAGEIRGLADSLLAQGIGAQSMTTLIAVLNDRLTQRILDLAAARHRLGDVQMCWLALGSEGRQEQTIATDQDNALIFAVPSGESAETTRERLLSFAEEVNHTLDLCGFPLCKGNIMASNPDLCLPLDVWRTRFLEWMHAMSPEALLRSMIFFDFRPLWGDYSLADQLRKWLAEAAQGRALFLRSLAEVGLRARAPIGFFGDFVTGGADASTIDLKLQGTRIFVDVARVFALQLGITATNTVERMRTAGIRLGIPPDTIEATVDAFHFLQMLRLRQQRRDPSVPNRIDPARLNELDRRILKESLRHARAMQQRLALDYRL